MTLTEKQKEEIMKSNKELAKNQFEMKQYELERILRNYNLNRVDKLRKASSIEINNEDEEEKVSKK